MQKQMIGISRRDRRAMASKAQKRSQAKPVKPGRSDKAPKGDVVLAAREKLRKADAARRAGNIPLATKICEELVARHPEYVGALHLLGLLYMDRDENSKALSCLIRAAMLNPQEWTILTSLGQVYVSLGAVDQAAHTLRQALGINSDDPATHYSLGQVLYKQREYEQAVESFERSLHLNPLSVSGLLWFGKALTHCGDLERAAEAYSKAYQIDPNAIAPIAELSQLPRQFVTLDIIAALDGLTGRPTDAREDEADDACRIAFARANAFDRMGQHDEAWTELMRANKPLHERYAQPLAEFESARHIRQQAAENYRGGAKHVHLDPDLPVSLFILGVSRSGKTSLERLLGAVPGVKRGYENMIVDRSARRASHVAGILTLEHLSELPPQLDHVFKDCYLSELRDRAGDAQVFTNTHPGQIADVGRLADLVPNSRFVFVRRDRLDTAIRMLMKHYQGGTNTYAYDLETALCEIDWYHNMTDLWHARLPDRCVTIRYEEMVADPAECIAAAAGLCGLAADVPKSLTVGDDTGVAEKYRDFLADQGA